MDDIPPINNPQSNPQLPQTQPPTPPPTPATPTLYQTQQAPDTQNTIPTDNNDPLVTNKTFDEDLSSRWTHWKCLVCGYVYEGVKPKMVCPRCGNSDPDKFAD